jgi:archaellum biogenesis ATPase FlaH
MKDNIVKYALEQIKANGLIEVRVIGQKTYSGYFKDVDLLIKELPRFENDNIYFILNEINEACYSREQKDKFYEKPKNTTSDNDITKRNWILIDVDSKRASGVSATDEEKNNSRIVSNKVFSFLRDIGFSEPICADSGNGYHLLYKIDLPNDSESNSLIKNFLVVLDMFFSVAGAEVDKTVFNASRITKLYGTFARKGRSTEERPHRTSTILRVPENVKVTPIELIKKVVEQLPEKEQPKFQNNYGKDEFDLDSFIDKHNIKVNVIQNYGDGSKYVLDNCFFDHSHKGKDAVLFKMNSGAIGYKCFHNSCSSYKWQDVRKMFEPTAYDKKYQQQETRITSKKDYVPQPKVTEKGNKFQQLTEIQSVDRSQIVSIPSGFIELDRRLIGFNKGEVTLWSGKNGSAKSTVLSQLMINGIERGFKAILFSGELQGHRVKSWINLQAAGRQYNEPTIYQGVFATPKNIADKINKWFDNKLWIYNNSYGSNFEQLMSDLIEVIKEKDIDFIIIDNLMALDIESLDGYKNDKQTAFIKRVSDFAKTTNIHIHLVAHPRKNVGFLRKEDIAGTADLTNMVDNVVIAHRNNIDFQKSVGEFFPAEMNQFLSEFSNYVEVCKNRDLGVIDHIVGLHYEVESKRLLNQRYENLCYDWQDTPMVKEQPLQPSNDFETEVNEMYNDKDFPNQLDEDVF